MSNHVKDLRARVLDAIMERHDHEDIVPTLRELKAFDNDELLCAMSDALESRLADHAPRGFSEEDCRKVREVWEVAQQAGPTNTSAVVEAAEFIELEAARLRESHTATRDGRVEWDDRDAWSEHDAILSIAKNLRGEYARYNPDDVAVDLFAQAMKRKFAQKREEGRSGWDHPSTTGAALSSMLRDHVAKGDPVDVANFAMMLHQRGERIAPYEVKPGELAAAHVVPNDRCVILWRGRYIHLS